MNEATWLSSENPAAMLRFLTSDGDDGLGRFFASDRKLRLFACACVDLHHPADNPEDLGMRERYEAWLNNGGQPESGRRISDQWVGERKSAFFPEKAALLRDLFGNPFRMSSLCGVTEGVLYPKDQCSADCPECRRLLALGVISLADAIYDGRDWVATPVLADALEEAGCTNEAILNHLRFGEGHYAHCYVCRCYRVGDACPHCVKGVYAKSVEGKELCDACGATGIIQAGGGHVRGCWVLDLLLGKQ